MTLLGIKICHKWRVAAFDCPRLWSRIDMTSIKYSSSLLMIQLERSGLYPLDITFNLLDTPESISNPLLQAESTALIERASSIANLSTRTLPPEWAEPLPLLESLHLIVSPLVSMDSYAFKPPNLRHLSVECLRNDIPLWPSVVRNLQTLHLHSSRDTAIKLLQIVLSIRNLQDLLLDACQSSQEASNEQVNSMIQKASFTPPQLVSLKSVSTPFLVCFLRPEIVPSSTTLRIGARPPKSFRRKTPATAAWIDTSRQCVLYEHGKGEGMTYIDMETPPDQPSSPYLSLYHMATFIDFSVVTSLYWKGRNLQDTTFQLFPSLKILAFEYYLAIVGQPRQGLKDIIGGYLASSCPHLHYLGISIRRHKSTSLLIQRDTSELEIRAFLEAWTDINGGLFSKVEIYDEYRPQRWENEVLVESLKALSESFEFKEYCVLEGLPYPDFKENRRFIFKEQDENLPSFRKFLRERFGSG